VPSISTADLAGFLNRIPYHPYETGLFMNLEVDIPMLKFDFSGYTSIKLHHFVKIAAKEARGIKTLVLSLHTASPFHEWLTRFEQWKGWGVDASAPWIAQKVITFSNLKEVILLAAEENMLPDEWGERAISFWEKDLMSLKGSWPVEWEANMLVLRIVTKLEDI
jgi:hypothetical protein